MLRFTPKFSRQSAAPDLLLIERLPCFATGTPPAEITNAEVVEMLNVPVPSPPVPTISITFTLGLMCRAFSLITVAQAVISSIVSPFIISAVKNAPICASVASPFIISFITCFVVSISRFSLLLSFTIASLIIFYILTLCLKSFPEVSCHQLSICFQGGTVVRRFHNLCVLLPLFHPYRQLK